MNNERYDPLTGAHGLEKQAEKTGKIPMMTNEQIREGGYMEEIVKAMEHDITDVPEVDVVETYKVIEHGVVGAYHKIEDAVVSGYKKIEKGAVSGFNKLADKFIENFFTREGETVEEAKERLKK